jgi:hypothetical protein
VLSDASIARLAMPPERSGYVALAGMVTRARHHATTATSALQDDKWTLATARICSTKSYPKIVSPES